MSGMGAHMGNRHTHTHTHAPLSGSGGSRDGAETSPGQVSRGGQKRVSRACDSCSVRKRRCDNAVPVCTQCLTVGADCTYNRRVRKRGPPKGYSFTHASKNSNSSSTRRDARRTRRRRPAWEESGEEEESEESEEIEESEGTEVSSPPPPTTSAGAELADTDTDTRDMIQPATGSPVSTAVDSLTTYHPTPSPPLGAASPHPTTCAQSQSQSFQPSAAFQSPSLHPSHSHPLLPPHHHQHQPFLSSELIDSVLKPLHVHVHRYLLTQLAATDVAGWDTMYAAVRAGGAGVWEEVGRMGVFERPATEGGEERRMWEGVVAKMTILRHNLAVLSTHLPPTVLSTPWGSLTGLAPGWSLHPPPAHAPGMNVPTVGAAYLAIIHHATTAFLHFPPTPRSSSPPSPPPPQAHPSLFTALHSCAFLSSILATILRLSPTSLVHFPPHTPALLAHAGYVLLSGQDVPDAGVWEHTKAATAVVVKALHVMAATWPEAGVAATQLVRGLESGVGSGNFGVKLEPNSTSAEAFGVGAGVGAGVAQGFKMENPSTGVGGMVPTYAAGMIAGPAPAVTYSSSGLPLQLAGAGAPVSPLSPTTPVSPFPSSQVPPLGGLAQAQGHAPVFGTTAGYSASGQFVFFPTSPGPSFLTSPSAWSNITHAQGVVSPHGWQYAPPPSGAITTPGLSPRPTVTSVASGYPVMGMTGAFVGGALAGSVVPQTLGQLAPHYRPRPVFSAPVQSPGLQEQDTPTLVSPQPPSAPGTVAPSALFTLSAAVELGLLGAGVGIDTRPSPSLALPAEHHHPTTTPYPHPTLSSTDYQSYPHLPMIRPRSGPVPFLTSAANMSDVVLGFGDMGGGGGGGSASLGKTSVEGVFSDSGSGSFAAVLDGDAVPVTDFFLEGEFGME